MNRMLRFAALAALGGVALALAAARAPRRQYPTSCLETRQRRCTACHQDTGPWQDARRVHIDILDAHSGQSLAQEDGTFLIPVRRGEQRRVRLVLGVDATWIPRPFVVGWLLVDPQQLASAPESSLKFAPGWEVNRPYGCKRLKEEPPTPALAGNVCATTTMTLRPLEGAQDGEVELQAMLKSQDETLAGNYFERRVLLRVQE